jgi:glycerol-1-phosphate dehydrogenase [NAD(P)+]
MWPTLRAELEAILLPRESILAALVAAGAPTTSEELGVDAETLSETIRVCRDMRSRYTVLDLAEDLGLLTEFSASHPFEGRESS